MQLVNTIPWQSAWERWYFSLSHFLGISPLKLLPLHLFTVSHKKEDCFLRAFLGRGHVREAVSLLTFPCWKMFHSVEGLKSYFQGGTYPCYTLQHSELVSPAILLCDPIESFTWEAPASPSTLVLYRTLA